MRLSRPTPQLTALDHMLQLFLNATMSNACIPSRGEGFQLTKPSSASNLTFDIYPNQRHNPFRSNFHVSPISNDYKQPSTSKTEAKETAHNKVVHDFLRELWIRSQWLICTYEPEHHQASCNTHLSASDLLSLAPRVLQRA